jgi:hypothetical protein
MIHRRIVGILVTNPGSLSRFEVGNSKCKYEISPIEPTRSVTLIDYTEILLAIMRELQTLQPLWKVLRLRLEMRICGI